MKTIFTPNTLQFLQAHPNQTSQLQSTYIALLQSLQQTITHLGQRLHDLTADNGDLSEIGKAQRALSGAMRDFHNTLANLAELPGTDSNQAQHSPAQTSLDPADPQFDPIPPQPPEPRQEPSSPQMPAPAPDIPHTPPAPAAKASPPILHFPTPQQQLQDQPEHPDDQDQPHPTAGTQPAPPKLNPPKKHNTRRKRKDPKYLRKLQKRHTPKQKAA